MDAPYGTDSVRSSFGEAKICTPRRALKIYCYVSFPRNFFNVEIKGQGFGTILIKYGKHFGTYFSEKPVSICSYDGQEKSILFSQAKIERYSWLANKRVHTSGKAGRLMDR